MGIVKVEIITRVEKATELRQALNDINVCGMTITNVMGQGKQKGKTEIYRGNEIAFDMLPKIKVELLIDENILDGVLKVAKSTLNTNNVGDGKIAIYHIDNVIRIRTGEEGVKAL
ncbi:P-II family nitrogen regulator [Helicobacter sp. 16-1353]|uniref:P-II family nitrogen regulator n=1 Tax=Helicobacter sp. 16-1353 TaxID=2004996 RepID=UPI000DCC2AF5|nr:P-II family nitrogen regulator [Helicobacter sp. 16-1353]RAX53859.1 P-II family nitrogen regulator [Helicobacter sp. 16-1353]